MRISEKEFQNLISGHWPGPPKRNKYGNIKCEFNGIKFDSKSEIKRYKQLLALESTGVISNIVLQPSYQISISGINICKVKLDFSYSKKGSRDVVVEDVKGKDNAISRLKRRLVEAQYGIKVILIKNGE